MVKDARASTKGPTSHNTVKEARPTINATASQDRMKDTKLVTKESAYKDNLKDTRPAKNKVCSFRSKIKVVVGDSIDHYKKTK